MRSLHAATFLAALAAVGLVQAQTFTIRRQFHPGEVDKYVSKMAMSQTLGMGAMGGQPMNMTMEQEMMIKTLKVLSSGNSADVRMTSVMKSPSMGSAMAMMGGQSKIPTTVNSDGTLDSRNRFVNKHMDNAWMANAMGPGSMGQTSGMLIELPDRPVRVGDSWKMQLPKMATLGMTGAPLTVTLVGRGAIHGHAVLKVKIAGSMPLDVDMGKMMNAMGSSTTNQSNPFAEMAKKMSMHMKGTMSFSGTGAVDEHNGKTAALDLLIGSHITVVITNKDAGGAPMTMKTDGTNTMATRLVGY